MNDFMAEIQKHCTSDIYKQIVTIMSSTSDSAQGRRSLCFQAQALYHSFYNKLGRQ